MEAFLESEGYQALSADGGEPGHLIADREAPDLILVDLAKPSMDGYEVRRPLRERATTRQTPIIMLTGNDDPALNREAYAAGAQAYTLKPFRREALTAVIQAVGAAIPREAS